MDNDYKTELAAKLLIEHYHYHRTYSPIFRAGLEVDLAKCYLSGKTILETLVYLKKEKNFNTSKTAIGRYWRKFARITGPATTA